eukprot:83858_1
MSVDNVTLKRVIVSRKPNFNLKLDDSDAVTEVFKSKPFAQGAFRYAYSGLINGGARRGDKVVIKKWKSRHVFDGNFWDSDLKCYEKAKELIDIWNAMDNKTEIYEISIPRKRICTTRKAKCEDHEVDLDEYVLVEDYLPGDFKKWNSNSGYVKSRSATIQAFCHWTYHYSNRKLIMCDAQGVKTKYRYRITDPCICSRRSGSYGAADCGIQGIHSFFANHQCNEYCDSNWMEPTRIKPQNVLSMRKTTTYTWEVGSKKRTGLNMNRNKNLFTLHE